MREPRTTQLDGNEWTLSLLGSSEGLKVGIRLVRMLGQGVADSISKSGSGAEALLAMAFSRADPDEVLALLKQLLRGCLMDGRPLFGPEKDGKGGIFETAFQGRLLLVFKLAGWAIKENAGDFSAVFGSPAIDEVVSETQASDDRDTFARIGSLSAPS